LSRPIPFPGRLTCAGPGPQALASDEAKNSCPRVSREAQTREKGLSTIPGRTDTILRILSRRPLLPSERAEGLPSFGDDRFQSGCGWSQGGERWRRKASHQSNVRSVDSNCARSCPWPTAPSMRWSSAASSRDASRSPPGALYGIWAKSKHGSPHVDPHPSLVRNILTLCNGALGR
jgi:hypothetical protein